MGQDLAARLPRRPDGPARPSRRPDWPARLTRFLDQRREWPFAWGYHDCCLAACDWVKEAAGWDPAAGFRNAYDDRDGALRALRTLGAGTLTETARTIGGPPLVSVRFARRGDVALIRSPAGPALGIVIGDRIAAAAPAGWSFVPLDDAIMAWRI